jgi:DNA-binding NarL/FixJ family response regulator
VRIVICDDVPELRELVRYALEEDLEQVVVGEAADGVEAVDRVRDLRPDVVVLDLSMPSMDGLQAIRVLHEAAPRTGIVIFTGFGSPSIRDQALSLGADAYVEKGADLDELRSAVADVGRRKVALRSASAGA